jgi:hypothetical protein
MDQEIGTCNVCRKDNVILQREYFHYNIICECHSPNHFVIVFHCKDCEPTEPDATNIQLKTSELPSAKSTNTFTTQVTSDGFTETLDFEGRTITKSYKRDATGWEGENLAWEYEHLPEELIEALSDQDIINIMEALEC